MGDSGQEERIARSQRVTRLKREHGARSALVAVGHRAAVVSIILVHAARGSTERSVLDQRGWQRPAWGARCWWIAAEHANSLTKGLKEKR